MRQASSALAMRQRASCRRWPASPPVQRQRYAICAWRQQRCRASRSAAPRHSFSLPFFALLPLILMAFSFMNIFAASLSADYFHDDFCLLYASTLSFRHSIFSREPALPPRCARLTLRASPARRSRHLLMRAAPCRDSERRCRPVLRSGAGATPRRTPSQRYAAVKITIRRRFKAATAPRVCRQRHAPWRAGAASALPRCRRRMPIFFDFHATFSDYFSII